MKNSVLFPLLKGKMSLWKKIHLTDFLLRIPNQIFSKLIHFMDVVVPEHILVTVCFLDSWLQTKCRVTFDIRVSDTVFHALSHGTFGFALHGSFFNHVLIGGNSSNSQSDSLE